MQQLFKHAQKSNTPIRILACAPSNSAADLLAERMRLTMDKTMMLRLYALSRDEKTVPAQLLSYTRKTVDGHFAVLPRETLKTFRLVVTTCINAATLYSVGCEVGDFTHIIIDEAGHATEPEALAALTGLINAKKTAVILGGDHHQLGPICRSALAVNHGLAVSLLERLLSDVHTNSGSPYYCAQGTPYPSKYITKLLYNYRSHPAIIEQPNKLFYSNDLIAAADVINRQSLCNWPGFSETKNKNFPILFHHLEGKEEREAQSPSWFNTLEVTTIIHYVEQLLAYKSAGMSLADIGIITPYKKQVEKIRILAQKKKYDTNILKIGSVEEFQGQERRVILISTVRSQLINYEEFDVKYNLGFINNYKRFNVSITRAKAALIVVGNIKVLNIDPNWGAFVAFCEAQGAIKGGWQSAKAKDEEKKGNDDDDDDGDMGDMGGTDIVQLFDRLTLQGERDERKKNDSDADDDDLEMNEEAEWRRDL